jgi:hypothetical protein
MIIIKYLEGIENLVNLENLDCHNTLERYRKFE